MADETEVPVATEPAAPAPAAAPVGYTQAQVDELLANTRGQIAEQFQQEVDQRLGQLLSTPEGQKEFANIYGLKLADVKAAAEAEEDLDPVERRLRAYEERMAKLEGAQSSQQEELKGTSIAVMQERFLKGYESELEAFVQEQPEVRDPALYGRLRRDVFAAIEADPRLGTPGNIKKMATAWWEDMTEAAPLVTRAYQTSGRSRGRSGAQPEGKKPEDMSPEEARAAILASITGSR